MAQVVTGGSKVRSLQRVDHATVSALRERMHRMQDTSARVPVATLPELSGVVQLRTGSSYRVDQLSLALLLLAAPSGLGGWTGIVGVDDLGVEAAAAAGLELDRTVLVPDPGENWLEATTALVDVLPMVLVRPPGQVSARTAGRVEARLRKRSATLLVQGSWPGSAASLSLASQRWYGAAAGTGRLCSRRVVVSCRYGTSPAREAELWLPALDAPVGIPGVEQAGPVEVQETG